MSANVPPTQNGAPPRPWDATRVSMVQNGTDTNTGHVTVAVILAGIRNGRWRKPVAHVKTRYLSAFQAARQQGDPDPYKTAKEAVHDIKKKLPGALLAVSSLDARTNISLPIRVCSVSILTILKTGRRSNSLSPVTIMSKPASISPTGSGLKVLLRIAPDVTSHERSFLAAQKYFRERYSAKVDNCKDLARLCFVSHDEKIFIRAAEATLLEPLPPEPNLKLRRRHRAT